MWGRAISVTVVGAVLVSVLSGCGGAGGGGAAELAPPGRGAGAISSAVESPGAAAGDELPESPAVAEIRRRGTLLVGVPTDAPDFVRRSEGQYRGFDVRIARILAEGLGMDPREQLAFRRLPPGLRSGAVSRGSVDVQLGGVERGADGVRVVAPYVVTTGSAGGRAERLVGVEPGDEKFRARLRKVLGEAVADGSWQHAAERTLLERRPSARPPELSGE
ncbi:ABC-type amino acid transport substrate-binding protein [Actinopolyspora biskrensis]|uniref:ABC-type amino acid transport substrate-binding protein n=1 Tax=Actinopolyspora biskrensis TaxID=1470178 RepID=A0A852YV83_9ACTN|nr:hypothetical protein [Actinopolyspora biskrensis]NYH76755.1 ABC-type amino acid transport substrate-binding protein [Actinopolyspora biskrensis]